MAPVFSFSFCYYFNFVKGRLQVIFLAEIIMKLGISFLKQGLKAAFFLVWIGLKKLSWYACKIMPLIDYVCLWKAFTSSIKLQIAQVKRLHSLLSIKDSAANIPKNLEARRRLEFFTNSLFMEMPTARPVREMLSFRWRTFTLCFLILF